MAPSWRIPTSRRAVYAFGFAICLSLLGYGYYAQYALGLQPCPLCIFQRIALMVLAVVFGVAAVHGPARTGARIYGALIGITTLAGIGIAGRHLYLQHLPPDQVPACGPGLGYMLDVFPLSKVLRMVFEGSGECASVDWSFLGISMPGWTLIWFVLLGVTGVVRSWMPAR